MTVDDPSKLAIKTTPDTAIHYGDNINLRASLDTPLVVKTVEWKALRGDSAVLIDCRTCTTTGVNPRIPTLFKVTVTDTFGCVITKEIVVLVDKRPHFCTDSIFAQRRWQQ